MRIAYKEHGRNYYYKRKDLLNLLFNLAEVLEKLKNIKK